MITPAGADVCDVDPGFDVRVVVRTSLRTMSLLWRGDISLAHALRSDDLVLAGDPTARRALPRWLLLSSLAPTPRPHRAERMVEFSAT